MTVRDALPLVLTTAKAEALGAVALLRNGTYRRAAHGVYLAAGADADDPDVRLGLAAATLPAGAVIGGWAAARLHEVRSLRGRGPAQFDGRSGATSATLPVLVLAGPEVRLVNRPYRSLLRSRVEPGERETIDGVPVTTAMRTAFDLARLGDLAAAVGALDRLRALGLVDEGGLAALLDERRSWRGARQARRALTFSADGVESPQETVLRLLWCESGAPRPRANLTVLDERGAFVARVDLIDDDTGVVGEYDGAVHASSSRRSADAARQERLEALGLVVVRATSDDVRTRAGRAAWVQRLRDAYLRAGARRADQRRWRTRT